MSTLKSPECVRHLGSQGGMVLLLCLIFLTAMMLLGLSASADTILQNQLAANLQETERAKQSAMAALLWSEQWLLKLDDAQYCQAHCDHQIIPAFGSLPAHPEFKPYSWWLNEGFEAGKDPLSHVAGTPPVNGSNNQSLWLIEPVHSVAAAQEGLTDQRVWYRILARGSNSTGTVVSVVESLVVRSWPSIESTEISAADNPGACSKQPAVCGRIAWRELR